jgi:hypothetical protein
MSVGINSIGGPWGANVVGGIEKYAKGVADKLVGEPDDRLQIGKEILKTAEPFSWMKGFWGKRNDALEKIHDVEAASRAGTFHDVQNPNKLDKAMELPATAMLMGDLNTRDNLAKVGISDEEAKLMTMTNEPRRLITQGLTNIAKAKGGDSVLAKAMQPFVRTAANVLESGAERTPVVGWLLNTFGDQSLRIPGRDILVQQGLGGIVWGLGFAAGNMVDEDTTRAFKLHSMVSNVAGQYSLLANAGFMAGQAYKKGQPIDDAFWNSAKRAYLTEGFPLPTTQPISDTVDFIRKVGSEPENLTTKDIPGIAVPGIVRFAGGELAESPGSVRAWVNNKSQKGRPRYVPRRRR